jgi:1,4-alpha-glucan branching enzyme
MSTLTTASSTVKIEPNAETRFKNEINMLNQGRFYDPFAFLGPHKISKNEYELKVFIPGAQHVYYQDKNQQLRYQRVGNSDLFILNLSAKQYNANYKLTIAYPFSTVTEQDPYKFSSTLDQNAVYLFNEGTLEQAQRHLGAHWTITDNVEGIRFTVWAPNATSVSLIGNFNQWNSTRHPMRKHLSAGIWEIFIADIADSDEDNNYKFSIITESGERLEKADPFASSMQLRPQTASCVPTKETSATWQQSPAKAWTQRAERNAIDAPITIYEVHAGSWKRDENNQFLSYKALSEQLVPYVQALGFTHIQLMPISEFPFDGSWGYQPVGLFAPTSRFGSLADFQFFVDACHAANIGLLIDWVPGHFPADDHGLAQFDGSHLFEHADKRQGFHPDWNTHIFNYDRAEVQSFLISNALAWFDNFAIDGLRVDAVASMLYLDYSRKEGEWIPNEHGGRENLGAIELLKQVNQRCYKNHPGIMMVAEESTAWPGVTNFVDQGGLGFGYKWNMGWMNDSLEYMSCDPLYRQHHHHEMTFSLAYAFSENFILPLSHDEVVHGKGSLLNKMPGDDWQKFANLRAYYGFMWAHPGKKLLFMGCEFGQRAEWNHDQSLDWHLLEQSPHQGVQDLIKTLNNNYCHQTALFELDTDHQGFDWIDASNAEQSVFSFLRYSKAKEEHVAVVSNMTPACQSHYRIGVPSLTEYEVLVNTDDSQFGGSGFATQTSYTAESIEWQGFKQSICIALPPLSTVYLAPTTNRANSIAR